MGSASACAGRHNLVKQFGLPAALASDQEASRTKLGWRVTGNVQLVGDPQVNPEHAAEIIFISSGFEIALNPPRRSWKRLLENRISGLSFLVCFWS